MLLKLAVRNYKSFGSEDARFELIPSSKEHCLKTHIVPISRNIRVLRNAVVYGSNAAGKSNIIDAIEFVIACVKTGRLPKESLNSYCKVSESGKDSTSIFDIQFSVDSKVYDYGFSCLLSRGVFMSEWLYDLTDKEPILLFERDDGGEFAALFESIALDEELQTRIGVYADDVKSDDSSKLFFTDLCKNRKYPKGSVLADVVKAWRWIARSVEVIGTEDHRAGASFYGDVDIQRVADLIASFDTGVSGFSKEKVGIEELSGVIPKSLLEETQADFEELIEDDSTRRIVRTIRYNNVFVGIEWERGWDDARATILKVKHKRSFFDYDFGEESDGTKRIFDFIDMLFSAGQEKLYVVDELSRSLHPMITKHFVELFNEAHCGDKCQIVFTTHEDAIMRLDMFRRDEIWFVERRADGCSHLYNLDDFAVRSDAALGKQYLEGRYGGIPILSIQESLSAMDGEDDGAD